MVTKRKDLNLIMLSGYKAQLACPVKSELEMKIVSILIWVHFSRSNQRNHLAICLFGSVFDLQDLRTRYKFCRV